MNQSVTTPDLVISKCDNIYTSAMCTLLFKGCEETRVATWPEGHEKTCETDYIGQYWNSNETYGNGNEEFSKETSLRISSSFSHQLLC